VAGLSLRLDGFEGPLELLWSLIERDQLDIHQIPIAHITDQYLRYLQAREWRDLETAGAFLVVAAQLVQLKLQVLLPKPEAAVEVESEPDPRQELVERLLAYRAFRSAAHGLEALAQERSLRLERPPALPAVATRAVRAGDAAELGRVWCQLLARAAPKYATIVRELDTIAITMRQLATAVFAARRQGRAGIAFHELMGAGPRRRWVTGFLALLELVRRGRVRADQASPLGEIHIRPRSRSGEVTA
jgi:segregation and condensation protein A